MTFSVSLYLSLSLLYIFTNTHTYFFYIHRHTFTQPDCVLCPIVAPWFFHKLLLKPWRRGRHFLKVLATSNVLHPNPKLFRKLRDSFTNYCSRPEEEGGIFPKSFGYLGCSTPHCSPNPSFLGNSLILSQTTVQALRKWKAFSRNTLATSDVPDQ